MKTTLIRQRITLAFAGCACAMTAAVLPNAAAQDTRGGDTAPPRASTTGQVETSRQDAQGKQVRVTRASNFLGTDVIATDDRKVGDIVDFYFDLSSAPHLEYVVIMTGGFLNMGGETRAVPASALTMSGDRCRITMSSDEFWDVPVLPGDRLRFLSDPQHRQRLTELFAEPAQTGVGARPDDPDRPGAMTGRPGEQREPQLVSFSELRNADAYGERDSRLGFFADVWINLNENHAPYVEITPTFQPFRTDFDRRYAVPIAKIAERREFAGYTLDITTAELDQADSVSEAEGVSILEEGVFGDTVLRVTVPQRRTR